MSDVSPFLHREVREEPRGRRPVYTSPRQYVRDDIDRYKAKATLEKLRYKRLYMGAIDLWIGSGGWSGIGGGGGGRDR